MTNIKQIYKEVKIFGKGDSAISFSPLEHYRKENEKDEGKGILKGYKIKVTGTNDMFVNKGYFYLEREELLNLILVLSGKIKESKSVRNEKTLTFTEVASGDLLVKLDIKGKDKLVFKISILNKIILYKMTLDVLLKEIPRTTNIILNKKELLEYIETLVKTTSETVENLKKETNDSDFILSFINTYNGKEFENKIKVSEAFYNYIKKTDIKKLDQEKILSTIKKNTIKDENKFLNKDNLNTLKCI